ncbi:conserved membrane protein of unknown function [Tenacibaculum sp. 190524A02b]|uniref:hypothetical protein n=1 Tax=Tenacibaculum vairaonense TaxID=3137860 RepID=UPI0032B15687
MSLLHIFYPAVSPKISTLKKEYKVAINNRNTLQNKYIEDLLNNKLTKEEYSLKVKKLLENTSIKVKSINKRKHKASQSFSFRGRSSFRFWIFVFGLVSLGMFFSCKSLYDDIAKGSNFKFQLVSLSGITVSFFWLVHLLFFTQKDFTQTNYVLLILFCAVLASVFTYYLIKYYTYKDDIILSQLSLLERIKTIHYPKLAVKARYAEQYGKPCMVSEPVSANINEFENDIIKTLEL